MNRNSDRRHFDISVKNTSHKLLNIEFSPFKYSMNVMEAIEVGKCIVLFDTDVKISICCLKYSYGRIIVIGCQTDRVIKAMLKCLSRFQIERIVFIIMFDKSKTNA